MSKTLLSGRDLFLTTLMALVLTACGGGNGGAGSPLGCTGAGGSTGSSSSSSSSSSSTTTSCSSSSSTTTTTTGTASTGVVGSVKFVSSVPSTSSIVFQYTGGVGRTSTAVLTFQVLDTQGNPMSGVTVNFSNNNTEIATLSPTSGTTNSSGDVVATVTAVGPNSSGLVPTAGTLAVTASAKGASSTLSAISNLVIVSTGTPAAKSFTIAPSLSSIEGWDFPGTTTTIEVLVTDSNGNPVVDGTPVAATTNEGAIGTSNSTNPGCVTTNGECQFVFTAQNPRWVTSGTTYTDIGIATISFSATDGSGTPITGSTQITQSGSWASIFALNNNADGWTFITGQAEPNEILSPSDPSPIIVASGSDAANCSNVYFIITDEVGNPIADGTTLSASTSTSGYAVTATAPTPIGNTPLADSIVDFTIPVAASTITNIGYLNTLNPTAYSSINPTLHAPLYNPSINGTFAAISFTGPCPTSSAPVYFVLKVTSAKGDLGPVGFYYYTN